MTKTSFPDRKAAPGTEVSWTDAEGSSRRLVASSTGRVPIGDEIDEAEAKASRMPIFPRGKPAAKSAQPAASAAKED